MKISFLTASILAAGLGLASPAFAQSAAAEGKVVQSQDAAPQAPTGTVQKQRPAKHTSQRHTRTASKRSHHAKPANGTTPPAATGQTPSGGSTTGGGSSGSGNTTQ